VAVLFDPYSFSFPPSLLAVGIPAILLAAVRAYQKSRFINREVKRMSQHQKAFYKAEAELKAASAVSTDQKEFEEEAMKKGDSELASFKRELELERSKKELEANQVSKYRASH
jgi:hypothetical protein